jgi:hypothetical protein
MANIIPGVPTPQSGDPTCVLSICGRIIAQVDCIVYIMQGTTGCIDIQLFDKDGQPLDLTQFSDIQIQLFNEFECVIANFWYPSIPTGSRGFLIEILQYTNQSGRIINKGLLRICLSRECTATIPSAIFAEILLTKPGSVTGGSEEVIGIPCIQVASILESKIYKNGGNTGCGLLL